MLMHGNAVYLVCQREMLYSCMNILGLLLADTLSDVPLQVRLILEAIGDKVHCQ